MTVYFIMILGIIIFTIFCNLVIGWESGYSVQFFSAISGSFYFPFVIKSEKRKSLSLTFCVTLLLSYILSYILSQMLAPIAPLSPTWTRVFFIMNVVISFSIIIMLSYMFVWELLNKQKILAMQNDQLDELAHKDPLTHLLNRRSMNEKMTLRMEQLKLTGKRFTLVLGDIDDFKKVNDNYGHDAGDIVLITVSDIIRQNVGGGGIVCRWGGEEILMILNESLESATEVTDRIRKRIDENIVNHEGNQIHVSMTFGVAESIPGIKIEHLIQQADDRLYYGKKHGKNQVVTSIPEG
ncbi:MAG: diguanylate cyclase, partial [Lachnospiraceae bacterium]|nr:diguanylate cyclase [Lachnospiraceae bacterium]